ncbi:MAG: DUF1016 family protein [Bacteroidales bacterium]|nr:DUF1016 family protein [Bacteroidales bacterium]
MKEISSTNQLILEIKSLVYEAKKSAFEKTNSLMIETYWNIGRMIVEYEQKGNTRADYGSKLLNELSNHLSKELGSGFSRRSLAYYRQFYLSFKNIQILHTRVQNLTWSHLKSILRVNDDSAKLWYLNEASQQNWSVRTLDRNVSSQYYYRLLQSPQNEKVIKEMQEKTFEFEKNKLEIIKSPIIAEFLGLKNNDFTETDLESSILTHLQKFLLELGRGFAFVDRQKHITTDAGDYYIDLVFYNFYLRCFVLIDLKVSQITHQDVGQMDMYVRMYDEMFAKLEHNPTIGIVLCAETSQDIARYSILHDNNQVFATKYLPYLPSKEELKQEIEHQKEIFRLQQNNDE